MPLLHSLPLSPPTLPLHPAASPSLHLPSIPTPPPRLSPPPLPSTAAPLFLRRRRTVASSCSPMPAPVTGAGLPQDCLSYARAYWVAKSIIAWNTVVDEAFVYLYASRGASLHLVDGGVEGEDVEVLLELEQYGLPKQVTEKFPHISSYKAYKVPESVDVRNLLKCQLAVVSFDAEGQCKNATGLQLQGVLDDMFAYSGPLGAVFSEDAITFYLWAPTAQGVSACVYKDPSGEELLDRVQLEELRGVWNASGPRSWEGCYYVYEVSVYHPSTSQIENFTVNDPYARGLSSDGRRTLFVDLECDQLKPSCWDSLADEKPELLSFSDISIYELHIRDFRIQLVYVT